MPVSIGFTAAMSSVRCRTGATFTVVAALVLAVIGGGGCEPAVEVKADPAQFADALARIDRFLQVASTVPQESAAWRAQIPGVMDSARALFREDLVRVVLQAENSGKAVIDYAVARAQAAVRAMVKAAQRARTKVVAAQQAQDANALRAAVEELANVDLYAELVPAVSAFAPSNLVEVRWQDAEQRVAVVHPATLDVVGWGLDATDRPRAMTVHVQSKGGAERQVPESLVFRSTAYLASVRLADDFRFAPDDDRLVCRIGAATYAVPVVHRLPPSPPPETVDQISVVRFYTVRDNKEAESSCRLTCVADGVVVGRHEPYGAGQTWEAPRATDLPPVRLDPVPVRAGRQITVRLAIETTGRTDQWDFEALVVLRTSRQRVLEHRTGAVRLDTHGTRSHDLVIVLPEGLK